MRGLGTLGLVMAVGCGGSAVRTSLGEDPLPPPPAVTPAPDDEPDVAGPPDAAKGVVRGMFPDSLDPEEARVGYVPEKKAFLFATGPLDAAGAFGLNLTLVTKDSQVLMRVAVCKLGDCPERETRAAIEALVRERGLEQTLALEPAIFPITNKAPPLVTLGALGGDVVALPGALELVQATGRRRLTLPAPSKNELPRAIAVVASPDGSLLGALVEPAAGGGGQGMPELVPVVFGI